MMVLTTGNGVNGFTLDQDIGEFILTHPNMNIPAQTREFAINASNMRFWESPVRQYVGASSTGRERIMELKPRDLHQRVPVILGSREEVERVVSYHAKLVTRIRIK